MVGGSAGLGAGGGCDEEGFEVVVVVDVGAGWSVEVGGGMGWAPGWGGGGDVDVAGGSSVVVMVVVVAAGVNGTWVSREPVV